MKRILIKFKNTLRINLCFLLAIIGLVCGCNFNKSENKGLKWYKIELTGEAPEKRIPEHVFWDGEKLFVVGGTTVSDGRTKYFNDMWSIYPKQKSATKIIDEMRIGPLTHSAASAVESRFYVFGGEKHIFEPERKVERQNTLWVFSSRDTTWRKVDKGKTKPSPRVSPFLSNNDSSLYLLDGLTVPDISEDNFSEELWEFQIKKGLWEKMKQKDNTFSEVAGKHLPESEITPLFGADENKIYKIYTTEREMDIMIVYDLEKEIWRVRKLHGEIPSFRHAPVNVWTGRFFIMYGGVKGGEYGKHTLLNDLWLLDVRKGRWKKVKIDGNSPPYISTDGVWTGKYFYLVYGFKNKTRSYTDNIWYIDLSEHIKE